MNYQEFVDKLKASPRPVVVDFWAPWCGPCKAIEPMLKSLDKEYAGRVDVWRVNADENQEVLRALRIYGIPTLVDRMLWILSGLALVLLAYSRDFTGGYWMMALIGGVIVFAAVRDRCPVWQALAPKIEALWKREKRA